MDIDYDNAAKVLSLLRLRAAASKSEETAAIASDLDEADGLYPRARCMLVEVVRHMARCDDVASLLKREFSADLSDVASWGAFGHPEQPRKGAFGSRPGWRYFFHGSGCCVTRDDGVVIDVDFNGNGEPLFDPFFYVHYLSTLSEPDWIQSKLLSKYEDSFLIDIDRLSTLGLVETTHQFRPTPAGEAYGKKLADLSLHHGAIRELVFCRLDIGDRFERLSNYLGEQLAVGNRFAFSTLATIAPARAVASIPAALKVGSLESTAVEIAFELNTDETETLMWDYVESERQDINAYVRMMAIRNFMMRGPERVDGERLQRVLAKQMSTTGSDAHCGSLLLALNPEQGLVCLKGCLHAPIPIERQESAATLALASVSHPSALNILEESSTQEAHYALALISGIEIVQREVVPTETVNFRGQEHPVYTMEEISQASLAGDMEYYIEEMRREIVPIWELWENNSSP